ncbi:hypothetical protein F4774DRAFT_424662 [Daldinia eschscholtzii]|nr:hypothetical protein F4774DRAFT_424662 [Daldinia eschscholtzii]
MVVQLRHEVVGTAIGVLIYSFLCLAASSVMIWLVWTHHERDSYVALLSYITLLGTASSIIQQFHTFIWWRDVKVEQYAYAVTHLGSPEVAIAGPSVGLDLVLFYIQYYTYNVEAMLTLFWAIELTRTVFKFANLMTFRRIKHRTSQLAKAVALVLPGILLCLLRLNVVQSSHTGFLILANFNIMVSLSIGSILLIAILVKYIYTRHQLISWNARYLFSRRSQEVGGEILNVLDRGDGRQSIYDRWLVLRFSIAFVVLGVFQLITILLEISQLSNHTMEKLGESANLSKERATNDFLLFLPGVSTSLLVFIVFGTTRTFRKKICEKFIPKMFRRKPIEMPVAHVATPREDFHADEDGMGFYNPRKQGPSNPGLKTRSDEATTTAESSEPSVFANSADTCCGLR